MEFSFYRQKWKDYGLFSLGKWKFEEDWQILYSGEIVKKTAEFLTLIKNAGLISNAIKQPWVFISLEI